MITRDKMAGCRLLGNFDHCATSLAGLVRATDLINCSASRTVIPHTPITPIPDLSILTKPIIKNEDHKNQRRAIYLFKRLGVATWAWAMLGGGI